MFRLQNYYFFVNIQKIFITFCLKKRRVITYQHVLTCLNFHFKSTNNIIYFKITQREKNKIGEYIWICNPPSIQ